MEWQQQQKNEILCTTFVCMLWKYERSLVVQKYKAKQKKIGEHK